MNKKLSNLLDWFGVIVVTPYSLAIFAFIILGILIRLGVWG